MYLTQILLAGLIAATPIGDWKLFAHTSRFIIEVDIGSLDARRVNGIEMFARVKFTSTTQIEIEGSNKVGAFYIDDFLVNCTYDTLTIQNKRLYAADGTLISSTYSGVKLDNPHNQDDVITKYIDIMCFDNKPKKSKPRLQV
jgi:hypothetical protein